MLFYFKIIKGKIIFFNNLHTFFWLSNRHAVQNSTTPSRPVCSHHVAAF